MTPTPRRVPVAKITTHTSCDCGCGPTTRIEVKGAGPDLLIIYPEAIDLLIDELTTVNAVMQKHKREGGPK